MKRFLRPLSIALVILVALPGCETPGRTAMFGAATGAVIGSAVSPRGHGRRGEGALVGAAIGAGTGYLLGKVAQTERRRAYDAGYEDARQNSRYDDDRYEPEYPLGRRTSEPGVVRSPYPPHRLIDVSGLPRGAKVLDPTVDRPFINP